MLSLWQQPISAVSRGRAKPSLAVTIGGAALPQPVVDTFVVLAVSAIRSGLPSFGPLQAPSAPAVRERSGDDDVPKKLC